MLSGIAARTPYKNSTNLRAIESRVIFHSFVCGGYRQRQRNIGSRSQCAAGGNMMPRCGKPKKSSAGDLFPIHVASMLHGEIRSF
jgi:hypothetical protein